MCGRFFSFAGWCCVLGLEDSARMFCCTNHEDALGHAVKVCRWNPCVSTLLAFAENGTDDDCAAIVHVVDTASGAHQTITMANDTCSVSGLDWCASGRVLFVSTTNHIVELRVCPANLTLRQYASLAE